MDNKLEINDKMSCIEMKDIYEKCMKEKKFNLCFPLFSASINCIIINKNLQNKNTIKSF